MTTIAWDGKTLAADTQHTVEFNSHRYASKLHHFDDNEGFDCLASMYGSLNGGLLLLDWVKKGAYFDDRPDIPEDFQAAVVVITKYVDELVLREYHSEGLGQCFEIPANDLDIAWGTGQMVAESWLKHGHDAFNAVKRAAEIDPNTGGNVETITFE